jgi:CRISPR-associated endonuclease/helicase Cas3
LGNNPQAERLLQAPILVCTIDHLMPAVEGIRGGRQIAPMLRLMTSDLVLDEPDEFDLNDLPALSRLVHWCGMLGSRVLLSSATLPPALVQGLFNAYREGRGVFQAHRGEPGLPLDICCAWFDEFDAKHGIHATQETFRKQHDQFVERRIQRLAKAEQRRKAVIHPLPVQGNRPREEICRDFAATLREQIVTLHGVHAGEDPKTGKRVSIGLVRMANIDPLVETTRALHGLGAPEQTRMHLCVYHSQHPLLVRAGIERRLDRLLNRKDPAALFDDIDMRAWLDQHPEPDQIFVVIATAVAEVGRDHDYDWAVVEPSSMRSMIQLAGRVRRHRPGACNTPNIHLLDTNLRHLRKGIGEPAFCWPGFESEDLKLDSHHLTDLLTDAQLARTDATARIQERSPLTPSANLVDLEHEALRTCMLEVERWWTTRAHLTGLLQRNQRFRDDPDGRQRYGLLPDADGEIEFRRFERDGSTTGVEALRDEIDLDAEAGPRVTVWGEHEYEGALAALAEDLGLDNAQCARRFGVLDLPAKRAEQGWWYHRALGFSRKK